MGIRERVKLLLAVDGEVRGMGVREGDGAGGQGKGKVLIGSSEFSPGVKAGVVDRL